MKTKCDPETAEQREARLTTLARAIRYYDLEWWAAGTSVTNAAKILGDLGVEARGGEMRRFSQNARPQTKWLNEHRKAAARSPNRSAKEWDRIHDWLRTRVDEHGMLVLHRTPATPSICAALMRRAGIRANLHLVCEAIRAMPGRQPLPKRLPPFQKDQCRKSDSGEVSPLERYFAALLGVIPLDKGVISSRVKDQPRPSRRRQAALRKTRCRTR